MGCVNATNNISFCRFLCIFVTVQTFLALL